MPSKISVIICTYNRDKFINKSLEYLYEQDLSKKQYEVIVVNNNCTDNTNSIVTEFIDSYPDLDCRQVVESNQGLSFARNKGLAEAQYPLVCYIDDDGFAPPSYLSKIQNIFANNLNYVGIGGRVIPLYETSEPDWYNPYLRMMVTSINFGDKPFKCYGKKYPAGCSMIYTKEILEQAGGFNEKLKWRADDKFIFHAVKKISSEIYYRPDIELQHFIDADRIIDSNFDKLSSLLGSEEKLRISNKGILTYLFKLSEFIFKYAASIIIAIAYTLKGQYIKGKYVIRFRWLALRSFIGI